MTESVYPEAFDNLVGTDLRTTPSLASVLNAIEQTIGIEGHFNFGAAGLSEYAIFISGDDGGGDAHMGYNYQGSINFADAASGDGEAGTMMSFGPVLNAITKNIVSGPFVAVPAFPGGTVALEAGIWVSDATQANGLVLSASQSAIAPGTDVEPASWTWVQGNKYGTDLSSPGGAVAVVSAAGTIPYWVMVLVTLNVSAVT